MTLPARLAAILIIVCGSVSLAVAEDPIDYGSVVHLDAEELIEFGSGAAYRELEPMLLRHGVKLAPVTDIVGPDQTSYAIKVGARTYPIFTDNAVRSAPADALWAQGTAAFFQAINDQMRAEKRLYALYGGNDLSGIVLTTTQAEAARAVILEEEEWPYIPTTDGPWFGMYHKAGKREPWWARVARTME